MEKIIITALVIFVRILNRPIKNQLIFLIVQKGIWFFVSSILFSEIYFQIFHWKIMEKSIKLS